MKPWIKHLFNRVSIIVIIFLFFLLLLLDCRSDEGFNEILLFTFFIYYVLYILFIIESIYLLYKKSMQKFYVNLVFILVPILLLFITSYLF